LCNVFFSHQDHLGPTSESPLRSTTSLTRADSNRDLLTSTVKNLKEGADTGTHTDVEVSLGTLDVIVEVVTESQNDIASSLTLLWSIVTSLKKEGSITVSTSTDTSKLVWRILEVSIASRCTRHVLAELVKENVAKDDIILIIEVDGEDHDDTITVLLEPDGLVGTIVDLNDLATAGTLRSLVHHLVKDGGKKVAGHARSKTSNLGCISLRVGLVDGDAKSKIILGLRSGKKASINLLEVLLTTVGLDLIPALARDGDLQLVLIGPKVPDDLVEVSDCDIDFLSLLIDELGVDSIINDTVVGLKSQRGCHFLCG